MYKIDSKQLAQCIDRYCRRNEIPKKVFHKMSAISSPTLTQWRQGAVVSSKSIERLEEYTGMSIDDFIEMFDAQQPIVDDTLEVREMLRSRPEARVLFSAAKNAPASAFYEAAALLLRYQEEKDNR